jgi:hypothetical protein
LLGGEHDVVTDEGGVVLRYLSDAQSLAQAAGIRMVAEDHLQQLRAGQAEGHTSADFERHTAAMLMAIVGELVDIGALKEDRLEAALNRHLANVDQYHQADKDQAKKQAGPGGRILERLFPDDNPE